MSILKWVLVIALFFSTSLFAGVAKIALLKGDATLEREGKKTALKNGDTLEEKDSVKTSKDAQIQIIFEDNTVITLGSESDFKIQEYLNENTNQKANFKFNQGAFKAITGKIGKSAPQNFTLETKTATIGIRGTIIKGKIDPKIGDVIFCEKGAISVRSVSTGVTVAVPAGKITTVMPNTPPTPPRQVQPADILNINLSLEPTPPPPAPQGESTQNTPSNSGASQAAAPQSIDSTPPPPPPPPPATFVPTAQTTTPTMATAALQTNLQTLTQDVVVVDIAQEIGVPVEQIKEQIISGDPITPPTNPIVPPTDPIIPPTNPIVPPTNPIIPPTNPITPPISGGGGDTYPSQGTSYVTLFSNMSASDGTTSNVLFPDTTTQTMVFDATNGIWKSSDNSYIVTSTDGNFSYISELSNTQTMYVKDLNNSSYNPILFKSFPSDANASGYLSDVSGLKPIPSTWHELVTSAKSVMGNVYTFAIKYEQGSYTRKWDYISAQKLFNESYYSNSEWYMLNNYAALYSDISNSDTTYQSDLITYILPSNGSYHNFYIHGVPDANQTLKNYGVVQDGGKWYFTYDKNNPYFSTTVNVYGDLPVTDAIRTSSEYIPFMHTTKGYPIYVVDRSGYKEMYSIKNFDSISNDIFNWVNNHFLEINTGHVAVDGSNIIYHHADEAVQQNVYLFYKTDENGVLIADSRNGKMVNPITGNALTLYTNYHLENGNYSFGPINNPLLDYDVLPTPQAGNSINYHTDGITPLHLFISELDSGNDFRKLAIEKASWSDKPYEEEIYVYSDYSAVSLERDFSNIGNTQTYIKFPASGNGIMIDTNFDLAQERNSSDAVVKNHFLGSITTGRVVQNETDGSNKIIFKHFDTMEGVITSDSTSSYGTTHNMYLFNEKDQFVNENNGGLDNIKEDEESKYNWIVHEEVNATTSQVAGVDLMEKVADSYNDLDLFISNDYNTSFATGAMSGFMVGGDTLANIWMGDISAFDTNASGGRGILTVIAPSNELNITSPVSMAGLSQTDTVETIPSASFLIEDMQAMIIESKTINGKTYDFAMATLPDAIVDGSYSYQNDYASWGYWVATEKSPTAGGSYAQGYWIAGYETPTGAIDIEIANSSSYSYNGNILGTLTNGTLASPIKLDADNSFKASIEFGVVNPVTITEMKFNTIDLGSVNAGDLTTTRTSAISGNTFSGNATNANTALGFKGKFFGPNAESIGGTWGGTFNNNALNGTGVFKAKGVTP